MLPACAIIKNGGQTLEREAFLGVWPPFGSASDHRAENC